MNQDLLNKGTIRYSLHDPNNNEEEQGLDMPLTTTTKDETKNHPILSLRLPISLLSRLEPAAGRTTGNNDKDSSSSDGNNNKLLWCSNGMDQDQNGSLWNKQSISANKSASSPCLALVNTNHNSDNDTEAIQQNVLETFSAKVDPMKTILQVFTSTRKSNPMINQNKSNTHNLYLRGTASKRYCIESTTKQQRIAVDVNAIGKKTRDRMELERRNRKEIVRMETNVTNHGPSSNNNIGPTLPGQTTTRTRRKRSLFSTSIQNTKTTNATKRRTTTIKKKSIPKQRKRSTIKCKFNEIIDDWMPDVSTHLPLPTSTTTTTTSRAPPILQGEPTSNVIRMHGLPMDISPEQIMKFFSGLQPQQIFVLPTHDVPIQDFDALPTPAYIDIYENSTNKKKKGPKMERVPSTFRVFVRFESTVVAQLAVNRTGETMRILLEFDSDSDSSSGLKQVTKQPDMYAHVAILVTHVPKVVSAFMLQNMAIHAIKQKTIQQTLETTELHLPPNVLEIIWKMTHNTLQSSLRYQNNAQPMTTLQWGTMLTSDIGRMEYYHILYGFHKELELEATPLLVHAYDAAGSVDDTAADAVHRLTMTASDWLLDEMERMEVLLRRAYQAKL